MMHNVAGLDLSLTSAAVVVITPHGVVKRTFGYPLKKTSGDYEKTRRLVKVAGGVLGVLNDYSAVEVGIEDYAFSRRGTASHPLAELGGVVKAQVMAQRKQALRRMGMGEARRFVFGGDPKDKAEVQRRLVELGHGPFANLDESDAMVIALATDAYVNRRHEYSQRDQLEFFDRLTAKF